MILVAGYPCGNDNANRHTESDGMKQLALKLLRNLANYSGGAATAVAFTAASGGTAGVIGGISALGIAALCLASQSLTEAADKDEQLERIETWLTELVRRFGRLQDAVDAIAAGEVTYDLVSRLNAQAVRTVFASSDDRIDELIAQDEDVGRLSRELAGHLARFEGATLEALKHQNSLLEEMSPRVCRIDNQVTVANKKIDQLLNRGQKPVSEADLAAQAADDHENARLRGTTLRQYLDELEYDKARDLADRSAGWLARVGEGLSSDAQGNLLEPLIDEGCVRITVNAGDSRNDAVAHLRRLVSTAQVLLARLQPSAAERLYSQMAFARSLLVGPAVGLDLLSGRSDQYAIRRRLAILLAADRDTEALDLIRGAKIHEEWVEKAVLAACRTGAWAQANDFMQWTLENAPLRAQRLCRLYFVECVIQEIVDKTQGVFVHAREQYLDRLQECDSLLKPLVDEVLVQQAPRHNRDHHVLHLAMDLAEHLNDSSAIQLLAIHLERYRPFDPILAHFSLKGWIAADEGWPHRLRCEGDISFERRLLAAALEARRTDTLEAAFQSLLRLAREASSQQQREQTLELLMELAQQLGDAAQNQVDELMPALVAPDCRQAKLWRVARMFDQGHTEEADRLLEELRETADPLWLQIHGQHQLRKGETDAGVSDLVKAARILDRSEVLESTATLALSHKRWDDASILLERLAVLRPKDGRVRASRAMALHHLGENVQAAGILRVLVDEEPAVPAHGVNAAACYLHAGMPEDAIDVLSIICDRPEPPSQAVVALAEVLVERGRAKEAHARMKVHRERFWGQYDFVASYWTVACAAEEEGEWHEALMRLRALQAEGFAPEDMIVEKSIDDLLALAKADSTRQRKAARAVLEGRIPWPMLAEQSCQPAYRAWAARTAERQWVIEDPVQISGSTIYCTNGFTVVVATESRHLEPIQSSGRGRPVVVDLTALITLQKLGMLETAGAYFGRLHVPAQYLFKMFLDSNSLRPHQPSQRTAINTLRVALAEGRMYEGRHANGAVRHLDEHYPAERTRVDVYHLADLLSALQRGGTVTDEQVSQLASVAHRPQKADSDYPHIEIGDTLLIELSTLTTLHVCGVLDLVISQFRVCVSDDDKSMILGQSAWFEAQDLLSDDHRILWEFLRDNHRVERHYGRQNGFQEHQQERGFSMQAFEVAHELDLPFLVDDRVLQAGMLNLRNATGSSAFGTSQLLQSMCADEHITREQYSDAILALMRYRYRFIVPDGDLLLFWASRSRSAVPGPGLQNAARYLRACLRDPGLFGGMEPTDPPSTIALRYYQAIEHEVGAFIGALWRDEQIAADSAYAFTTWSLTHLLPSPPASMEPMMRNVADFGHPLFWSSLLFRLAQLPIVDSSERAKNAVHVVAECLGIPVSEVIRKATRIIHETASRDS